MKFAVTSQNYRAITPHAGKTRKFLIIEAEAGSEPVEIDRLNLPQEMAFHNFRGQGDHPVDQVDVMIVGSCGEGFIRRLAQRGVQVVATSETDPFKAVKDYLAGSIKPPKPHDHHHSHAPNNQVKLHP